MSRQVLASIGVVLFSLLIASISIAGSVKKKPLTDDEVAQILIDQSIASYPQQCACPYSSMKNGRSCGGRSAYSRPGGYSPLCYRTDVTTEQIQKYRLRENGK